MKIKTVIDEDFSNYKVPAMVVAFPSCSFKCGNTLCQNFRLRYSQDIEMSYEDIMKKFTNDAHFTVICRYNPFDNSNYGEVSFRTMELVDYFLWIYLDIDKLTELINKFNLKTN